MTPPLTELEQARILLEQALIYAPRRAQPARTPDRFDDLADRIDEFLDKHEVKK